MSVHVFRQDGNGCDLDALFQERLRLIDCRLADDAAGIRLAVMDLAGFLGKLRADVLGIGLDRRNGLLEFCRASRRMASIASVCILSFPRAVDTDGAINSLEMAAE